MADDHYIPTESQIKLATHRTRFLMHTLCFTGLMYKYKVVEGNERVLRMIRAIFLINLVGIQMLYSIYYVFGVGGSHRERSVVVLCWLFQSFMSMCLLVWWQYKGRTRFLIRILPWEALKQSRLQTRKIGFFGIMVVMVVVSVVSFVMNAVNPKNAVFDRRVLSPFYGWERTINYAIVMYAFFVWSAVFTMYSVLLLVIHEEVVLLNQAVEKIGSPEFDKMTLTEQLLQLHERHASLCFALQQTDQTFEVYNFVMFTTNIPTTIFALLSCYDAIMSSQTIDMIILLPELVFCIIEILGLTMVPAKITATLETTERLLYNNRNLWKKYDPDVHIIVNTFVKQNRQPGLGMSVWGFAIVTKSLVLTTASLVITYMTLLLQMSQSPGETGAIFQKLLNSSNNVDEVGGNFTV
ncbi:unnamed protein product [Bursaphelenchus xylophilus]|uniref:(pine wood nematode) hypothetical protein n=1 Tax=Bursaphelenchus xylophilus TaxID=6326 RepID=A0A1I7SCF0_BURXY|nr:unnamed protein product [Bursaphelenchus xylophilus]CAG9094225.1 unnamed protein product [Bursaphelenchus xylophilus]